MNSVPVIIRNVDLEVEIQTNTLDEQAKLRAQLDVIERIKQKFGNDVLLEQLSTLLCGTVSRVTISKKEDQPIATPQYPVWNSQPYVAPVCNPAPAFAPVPNHGGWTAPPQQFAPAFVDHNWAPIPRQDPQQQQSLQHAPPPLPPVARDLGVTQGAPTAYPYTHMMQSDKFRGKQVAYIKAEDLFTELDYAPWALTDEDKSAVSELRKLSSQKSSNINANQIPYDSDNIPF